MSLDKTIGEGEETQAPINQAKPIDAGKLDDIQKEAEAKILQVTSELRTELDRVLGIELTTEEKFHVIGAIEGKSKAVNNEIQKGGSSEYISSLQEFQTYLAEGKQKILETLSAEDKAKMDEVKSTGTGASNDAVYKANRNMQKKAKSKRMF